MDVKRIATIGVILMVLLCTSFFLMYEEYQYTFVREQRIIKSAELAEKELTKAIYESLKRESLIKVNRVAKQIRKDLLINYGNNLDNFIDEYEYPTEDSILVTTIDEIIHNDANRFFYVESDANDMFVASTKGIVSDKSEDCSVYGITRTFEEEISMHYNKPLAEQAIEAIQKGDKKDIFWRFKNTTREKSIGLKYMDLKAFFDLPREKQKDYEFLSVAYIDKYNDILGVDTVSTTGKRQDSRKLAVVQGFNLSEQIDNHYTSHFLKIEKDKKIRLSTIDENRRWLTIKLILNMFIIFISFFSIANLQNAYVKVGEGEDVKNE